MNRPPSEFEPVAAESLRAFVAEVFRRCGTPPRPAEFLADLLVTNDLRGVFSHGSRQTAAYVEHFRAGQLNPAPEVTVVSETPASALVDGDGGLGYFAAHLAATLVAAKARAQGVAVAVSRNHGHIGAAGIYSRVPLAEGLFCFVTSGHQLNLQPSENMLMAAGGSPMSFAIPAGEEPPLVLDFGAMHDLYPNTPHFDQLLQHAPSAIFRSFGLGCVCQALGGFLAGVPVDAEHAERRWSGANQGSFIVAVDLELFMSRERFGREMDAYARKIRSMLPVPGHGEPALPGQVEQRREREYSERGIPVGARHAELLRKLAAEFDLPAPV